jgi:ADP-ribose pyrophosphatase YjhB (NUDIX family)
MIKVVGGVLIQNLDGKFLAIRLDKEVTGGVIVPPGGKLEQNETIRDCIVREAREELGIEVELQDLAAVSEEHFEDGSWVFVYYNGTIVSGTPTIREPEKALEILWVEKSEFKNSQAIHWL